MYSDGSASDRYEPTALRAAIMLLSCTVATCNALFKVCAAMLLLPADCAGPPCVVLAACLLPAATGAAFHTIPRLQRAPSGRLAESRAKILRELSQGLATLIHFFRCHYFVGLMTLAGARVAAVGTVPTRCDVAEAGRDAVFLDLGLQNLVPAASSNQALNAARMCISRHYR